MATTITSISQLKKILEQKVQQALMLTQEEIYAAIQYRLSQYYEEPVFDEPDRDEPDIYKRTNKFLGSLIKTQIVKTGKGLGCSVGLDKDYIKYQYPGNPSWDKNVPATGLQVASWANDGLHGGNISGDISFWDDAIEELGGKQGILNIMKRNLKRVGIPVA